MSNEVVVGQYTPDFSVIWNLKTLKTYTKVFYCYEFVYSSSYICFTILNFFKNLARRNNEVELTSTQIRLRGRKLLECRSFKRVRIVGDDSLYFDFHLMDFDEDFERSKDLRSRKVFDTNWTSYEIDFFDFNENHVVCSFKRSRSFGVVCIKTGAKLWRLNQAVNKPFIVLRDFQNGLLLANDLTGCIR